MLACTAMTSRPDPLLRRAATVEFVTPVSLFALAFVARIWAAGEVSFAPTEGSAYYVGVARNLVEGRGFVTDAVWSYAAPPIVVPKPAFELWLPMASVLAAISMAVLGTTLAAAQLSSAVVGALVAPLAWAVAREAAERNGLGAERADLVAVGSGLVVAVSAPFLVAVMAPDSATPFTTFAVAACLMMPAALGVRRRSPSSGRGGERVDDATAAPPSSVLPGVVLGFLLGLAYLSRQEAIYLGLAYLVLLQAAARGRPASARRAIVTRRFVPVVAAGAAMIAPWSLRNLVTFGSPFPVGTLDNAWLTHNEQIFAYAHQPSLERFLEQGPSILVNQFVGLTHNLFEVLLVPAAPVGFVGLLALVALRRSPAVAGVTALRALLVSGIVTYAIASLVFPVATRWGTFLHAAGPLLVALTVLTMLALDALVSAVRVRRRWSRSNAWLAPAAVLALSVPLAVLQVSTLASNTAVIETRFAALAGVLSREQGRAVAAREHGSGGADGTASPRARRLSAGTADVLVSDHPIWLAESLRRRVLALPDEPPRDVWRLAHDLGANLLVIVDGRGRYPAALDEGADGAECFERVRPEQIAGDTPAIYRVLPQCSPR